jgi:predicted phosphodiesterase
MRYLVISDIHANLPAFEAVLEDAKGQYDKVWCLGDVVGYGPHCNECIELLASLDAVCVAGNHDWATLGRLDMDDFNPDARAVLSWTHRQLTQRNLRFLEQLSEKAVEGEFTLVHGSPRHPIWEYILYPSVAQANFAYFDTRCCLVGHTHSAVIFQADGAGDELYAAYLPDFNQGPAPLAEARLIINPGSVGQPRDGDPRASYALLDVDQLTLECRRVAYPVERTQESMQKYGLPPRLIGRLTFGW